MNPVGEPGWSMMLAFCCEYATGNSSPLLFFDQAGTFCVRVDEGSTPDGLEKLVKESPFCGMDSQEGRDFVTGY
ncbi:hypothetical protein [Polystyrenella longa]|nr:hypothetical protein [Polystyrenella longa]